MSIQIVTCMGRKPKPEENYYILDKFLMSCAKFGFTPTILGESPGEFNGLLSKAKLLKRAIESGKITADHIIFTDAFDVVFAADPHKIIEKFQEWRQTAPFSCGIIWNAERACFPNPSLAEAHPKCTSSFKYLNSGWGCGETAEFLRVLQDSNPEELPDDHRQADGSMHHSCDQTYWQNRMIFGEIPIGLDTDAELCWAMCGVSLDEIGFEPEGKIKNLETGSIPFVLHFNGGLVKHTLMPKVLNHLGYA